MVARGDMGVEIDFTEIPIIQKNMIAQCVACGKPVITATQMLDSMMENPRPTRAEITDVANAIYDGTSAIMLSGETAAGKYPVEAVQTMDAIALRTEADINYAKRMRNLPGSSRLSIAAATAHAACTTAMDIGADAILTVSQSGATARLVSRFRPGTTVVACLLSPAGPAADGPVLGRGAPADALCPEHRPADRVRHPGGREGRTREAGRSGGRHRRCAAWASPAPPI